ncbi:MAG: plasmid mobilization relaxosome protein MobC [Lachnospiraceae bacterium]|nr:plasmid mobilization relaxosome protein MobC [Lachnospiraceae bacterium]
MNVKSTDIHFRVSADEKEVVEKAAKAAGKTLSEYVREVILAASDYEVTNIAYVHSTKLQQSGTSRKEDIHIRISEEEMVFYESQAKEAGCSVSEYVRRSANGNNVIIVPGMKEVARQIAKLGVNINQLATLAHQGRIKEVDLFACNDTLKQVLKKLIEIKKG